jgi:hypothetical protein
MTDRLKEFIFNKLSEDLSHVEIILHGGSLWFVDKENKYWYLELQKLGRLFWRWGFFDNFFKLFGMEKHEFEPLITEWVELFLNREVIMSESLTQPQPVWLESVIAGGITKTMDCGTGMYRKIDIMLGNITPPYHRMGEIL